MQVAGLGGVGLIEASPSRADRGLAIRRAIDLRCRTVTPARRKGLIEASNATEEGGTCATT